MKKWIRLFILFLFVGILYFTLTDKLEPETSNERENSKISSKEEKYKVVIDPGHGGEDPGAIGVSGSYEKDFTLSLAKKISILLEDEPKLEVYMTREEDVFLSAETRERPNYANDIEADLYISLHANTFTDPSVSGTESFYYHKNSKRLANIIHRHVSETTGFRNRGVKKENYFVLKDTTMPAVLLEIGYITNPEEEQTMLTDDFQQSLAEAIKNGVNEYLK
ncbi:N-acetylmuramoyl-L-alanine amidase [Gracilibacillus salitolerans]|uniref:N-acetylmuramoyl-L-alanine amidase n=1 Tax=Gracilibacillus salitolerans TaxID=2663022 RepID=A0A5Q2TPW5_9BACI|nr:N-acetylmuramoyl-L-alanine amidase [Gracilibacillus salitolerans]QGH36182.1 N-acetylmuramoyl-L-alanine amidase [Gracilibacillus salitolerans]